MIKVLYFASLREALGVAAEEVDVSVAVAGDVDVNVAALRRQLAARGDAWQALLTTKNLRAAVNQRLVDDAAVVRDGDEVAFFPPVTGG